ncbi:MAG: adenylate kinase [Bacteroidia bacterium]|nr:adenylate kinase [Bacteroidia bacterium]MDW8334820.1 adenylate kinase [Bacteroidia bacterium]
MPHIVLFGPPGSGKGTQSALLKSEAGMEHLSTGDALRAEVAAGTPLGKEVESVMASGALVSDELVIGVLKSRLERLNGAKGVVFDGFPRTVAQAQALDELLASRNESIAATISLVVDRDELVERLFKRAQQEGRTDDTRESIAKRFDEYQTKTLPVADYYRRQNKLVEVNGTGEIRQVFERIRQAAGI